MATKKEIFETVTAATTALCEQFGTDAEFNAELNAILTKNLAPKNGGVSLNIDEVTHKDEDGNITEIMCSVSGVFLPATKEFFYEDKTGKSPLIGLDGVPLKRLSRQAESIRKAFIKSVSATEKAVMTDVLDGRLTPEEAKEKIAEVKAAKPDYSAVSAELPEAE